MVNRSFGSTWARSKLKYEKRGRGTSIQDLMAVGKSPCQIRLGILKKISGLLLAHKKENSIGPPCRSPGDEF